MHAPVTPASVQKVGYQSAMLMKACVDAPRNSYKFHGAQSRTDICYSVAQTTINHSHSMHCSETHTLTHKSDRRYIEALCPTLYGWQVAPCEKCHDACSTLPRCSLHAPQREIIPRPNAAIIAYDIPQKLTKMRWMMQHNMCTQSQCVHLTVQSPNYWVTYYLSGRFCSNEALDFQYSKVP